MFLAGCGGGALSTPRTDTPVKSSGTPEAVKITVLIGGTTAGRGSSSGVRRPKFISPSTGGIDFKVYAHGGNTIIGQSDTDISSGSAACGGRTGTPRTCSVQVPAPPGNDDFVATTYDAAPVSGSFSSAHVLGTGALNAVIQSGQANNLNMYVSGVINTLGFLAPHASLPADGATHVLGFVLNPSDFDNNPITAGANDPYANPILVAITEHGGSGHAFVVKNGTNTSGTSTTLYYSSDTVGVQYDGGGATNSYYISVAVSSTNVSMETLVISPMYVTSPSPYASGRTLTFTASGQTAQVNLSEPSGDSATQYHATPSASCAGAVSASNPAPGPSSSTTVTGNSATSCTIAFSDGTSTITWNVNVATAGAQVTVPSGELGPIVFNNYSYGRIQGQSDPASGKPWLSNSCINNDYDANVEPTGSYPSSNWSGFTQPTKALQFSNAVTQTCFSGLATPEGPKTSGYPNAITDTSAQTQCGSTCNPYFSFEFVATSSTGAFQPDLEVSFSPVFANNGARMAWVGLWHTTNPNPLPNRSAQSLLIFTEDVEGHTGTAPCSACAKFVAHEVQYADPTVPHKIGLAMNFVQPGNDTVTVYVDGMQQPPATTIRSWEDYYLFDTTSPGYVTSASRAVDDVLFYAGDVDKCVDFNDFKSGGCTTASGRQGHTANNLNGFLITNVTTCSGTAASCAGSIQTSSAARSAQSRTTSSVPPPPTEFRKASQVR